MINPRIPAIAGCVLLLAACGTSHASVGYTFNAAQPACKVHQKAMPTSAYSQTTSSLSSFSLQQAGFLKDYAPHQQQSFCDGAPATATDQAWATLFTRLSKSLPGSSYSDLDRPDLQDP